MNDSFEDYERKLENIIKNIKLNNKIKKTVFNKEITKEEEIIKEEEITNKEEIINEEEIINKKDEENNEKNEVNKKNIKKAEKDFYCKQLDSLNYCLEMHKVRKNKKADFDIHSIQKYNINDKDIDKPEIILGWKDFNENEKNILIEEFIEEIMKKYNVEKDYTKIFVYENINKIKYDKNKKKISDITGMIHCIENKKSILKMRQKIVSSNSQINKLRKSLISSKKMNK